MCLDELRANLSMCRLLFQMGNYLNDIIVCEVQRRVREIQILGLVSYFETENLCV